MGWSCGNCGFFSQGEALPRCPECGRGTSPGSKAWRVIGTILLLLVVLLFSGAGSCALTWGLIAIGVGPKGSGHEAGLDQMMTMLLFVWPILWIVLGIGMWRLVRRGRKRRERV